MPNLHPGTLTDIAGLRVGHWSAPEHGTGCTVVLCPPGGAVAGVDVRGGAPGTRETDLLRPECTVERVHAVVLAGGSAYGLAAADGAMRWLEEQGMGYDVGIARVPIVPAAVLFDLPIVRPDRRPDADAGYAACVAAHAGLVEQGSVGAGTGASVGKGLGLGRACKGGLGCATLRTPGGLVVAALAVVNAFGNVYDIANGQVVAGIRRAPRETAEPPFVDAVEVLAAGQAPSFAGSNTTLAVVATNGQLRKHEATKVAQMAHDGMARAVRPVHSGIDGDVIFALACGDHVAPVDLIGALAADALARAIVNGVRAAQALPGQANLPCAADLDLA